MGMGAMGPRGAWREYDDQQFLNSEKHSSWPYRIPKTYNVIKKYIQVVGIGRHIIQQGLRTNTTHIQFENV